MRSRPVRSAAPAIGFALGAAVAFGVAIAWTTIGSPLTWPSVVSLALQQRRGEGVYNANCVSCHGGTNRAAATAVPSHDSSGHTWHHPDCSIKLMIREGSAAIFETSATDGPQMPAFKQVLSATEIDDVVAYIKTMWLPGQRTLQAEFTQQMCSG